MKKVYLSLLLMTGLSTLSNAQLNLGGIPWSLELASKDAVSDAASAPIVLKALDFDKALKDAELLDAKGGMYKSAIGTDANITLASGHFTYLENGRMIWRTTVQLPGAKAVKPFYKTFRLPVGVSLYVSNANGKQVIGAFNHLSNNERNILGHQMVQGDVVVFEMDIDAGVNVSDIQFDVSKLFGVYRGGMLDVISSEYGSDAAVVETVQLGAADTCHVNAKCPAATNWDILGKTVAHIFIYDGGSTAGFCSGNLINNTSNDCRPLLLTASHCDDANAMVDSLFDHWEFTFGFQYSTCYNVGTPPENKVLTGANFVARSPYPTDQVGASYPALIGDFLLLELRDESNQLAGWDTYLGGWDRRTTIDDTVWVGFHHPAGDVKKFSKSTQMSASGTFNQSAITNTHWYTTKYTVGGVEGGSSGSALFKGTTGRIIGDLSGGNSSSAVCGSSRYSLYSKLSFNWEYMYGDTTAATQLKSHLDPAGTDVEYLDMAQIGTSTCTTTGFTLGSTAISDANAVESCLYLYPNPSNGMVRVKYNSNFNTVLIFNVYNTLGAVVKTFKISATSKEYLLDMTDLVSGVYMVSVKDSNNNTVNKKIVISR
ncbi:MAG: T9SS type A sorting domain-containing protein [Edaphocola sp.]